MFPNTQLPNYPNLRWQLAQWAEIRWWRRYLKKRDPEVYLRWKKAYWEELLHRTGMHLSQGARMLDAGCGPAGIFMALPGCRVDAVDPLLDHYATLAHFERARYPWVTFHAASWEDFPLSEPYDTVFCLNALNHMRDIPGSVHKLFQSVKPGGKVAVSVDVHKNRLLRKVFRRLPFDVLHPFQEDLEGYRQLFAGAGFSEKNAICYKKGRIFDYWIIILQKTPSWLNENASRPAIPGNPS
jgi:2-polyprenyl-6-hydroxyphenyl methylase/3-demethylubiquinone-9 3-methyltransferase